MLSTGATTKSYANASVLETDIICLLSNTKLDALLESTNYKPDEYDIESNTYEDLAEDSDVHWVLARASGEVGKAEFESELDDGNTREAAGTAARIAALNHWKRAKESFEITW
ncbi:hypothetical protein BDZ91DRAFT_804301 [Kalaharituber pfeilii]|nr:hypothetical protein BDZ91DRAFT_804301 [Kalaharituber pfeilii]